MDVMDVIVYVKYWYKYSFVIQSVVPTKVLLKCIFECYKEIQLWKQREVGQVGLLGLSSDLYK